MKRIMITRFLVAFLLPFTLMIGVYGIPAAYAHNTENRGPRTWHVSVGGQSSDGAIQGEAYYPHIITIDVGDTVVWTLSSGEPHTVTFFGTGPRLDNDTQDNDGSGQYPDSLR